ncbi:MAG: outer membrane protein [Crocinitomix sp.]|jgi:outer membrane protein
MKITIQNILTGVLLLGMSFLFYLQFTVKENLKTGFVRSQELVYQFDGMIDAMTKFEQEQSEWNENVETLKSDYQTSVDNYNNQRPNLSEEEMMQQENLLQHQYNNVAKYAQEMETALIERETEILEGVLNQVNAFSESFATANELDLLITTAESGTILYGDPGLDYTEELLESINSQYNGTE